MPGLAPGWRSVCFKWAKRYTLFLRSLCGFVSAECELLSMSRFHDPWTKSVEEEAISLTHLCIRVR